MHRMVKVALRLWVHAHDKISMSQTWLYNFFYKKATRFLQQPVAMEGIWL